MQTILSRRTLLTGLGLSLIAPTACGAAAPETSAILAMLEQLGRLEFDAGGRLGVAIIDSGSAAQVMRRETERFPMCSTFKLLACANVLAKVDAGSERLDRAITYGPADLLDYAPVTKARVDEGGMSLGDLCAAAIDYSDNTAANLILDVIGGPAGFTAFVRLLGDDATRLDRNEPSLNTSISGDERDTTTPLAMLRDIAKVLLGEVLTPASRQLLTTWLIGDQVGGTRIRAGVPLTWRVGDKTGSGYNGTANTLAILWPPDRAPILASVYLTGATVSVDARNAVHKAVGKLIAETFIG